MADGDVCLRCGKPLVVHGSVFRGFSFRPEGLRMFSLSFQLPEVLVSRQMTACAACGLVCAELDPVALRQKLNDLGNEQVKARLGALDDK